MDEIMQYMVRRTAEDSMPVPEGLERDPANPIWLEWSQQGGLNGDKQNRRDTTQPIADFEVIGQADPEEAKRLYTIAYDPAGVEDVPATTDEDLQRRAFRNEITVERLKDLFEVDANGNMTDRGRNEYAMFLLDSVARGIYMPAAGLGRQRILDSFNYALSNGRMDFTIPGDNDEAKYNWVIQVVRRAKDRECSLAEAIQSDALYDISKSLALYQNGEKDAIAPIDEGMMTRYAEMFGNIDAAYDVISLYNENEFYVIDPWSFEVVSGHATERGAKNKAENIGGFVVSANNGVPGLPNNDDSWDTSLGQTEHKIYIKEPETNENREYRYWTQETPEGDTRYIFPVGFNDDGTAKRIAFTDRELAVARAQAQYNKLLNSSHNVDYINFMTQSAVNSLSSDGRAWLEKVHGENNPYGLLDRDSNGTYITQASNLLSEDEARAFNALPKQDQDTLYYLFQLYRPVVQTDSFWKTTWYGVTKFVDSTSSGAVRGGKRLWNFFTEADTDENLAKQATIDKMNAIGTPSIRTPYSKTLLLSEAVPETALFLVGSGTSAARGILTQWGTRLGMSAKVAKVSSAVVAELPNMTFQTLIGTQARQADYFVRYADDPEKLRKGLALARLLNLTVSTIEAGSEYVPMSFAQGKMGAGFEGIANAIRKGDKGGALKATAGALMVDTPVVAFNEVLQESAQGAGVAMLDNLFGQMTDNYIANSLALDAMSDEEAEAYIKQGIDWVDVFTAGAESIPENAIAALGLVGITQGVRAVRTPMDVRAAVNQVRHLRQVKEDMAALSDLLANKREANGIHLPQWQDAVRNEVEKLTQRREADAKKNGRELTDEDRVKIQDEARQMIAMNQLEQLYNRWANETDKVKQKRILQDLGFSENEVTRFENLFEDLFHDRQGTFNPFNTDVTAAGVGRMLNAMGVAGVTVTDVADVGEEGATGVDIDWGNRRKTRVVMTPGTVDEKNVRADGVWIHRKDGTPVDASAAITDLIRVATSTDTGSTALVGHELAHNLLSIARDTEALSKEQWEAIQKAYTLENGRFDEERLADDFGFYVTDMLRKNAKDYRVRRQPNTAAGRALHAVAAFFGAIARAVLRRRNAEAVRNFDVGSVLETFLREGEAIRYSSTVEAEAARDAWTRATVVDEDGTEVAYHERGDRNVTAEDFERTFGMYAPYSFADVTYDDMEGAPPELVEFTKTAQRVAQEKANGAYDGLMAIAKLMGVPPETLSLGGLISPSFGRLYPQGFNGIYFSNIGELVIPTKRPEDPKDVGKYTKRMNIWSRYNSQFNLAESTAIHEWMHALDHALASGRDADWRNDDGTAETPSEKYKKEVRFRHPKSDNLVGANLEDRKMSFPNGRGPGTDGVADSVRPEVRDAFAKMMEAVKNTAYGKRQTNALEWLKDYPDEEFYLGSAKKTADYYSAPDEMLARAFEQTIVEASGKPSKREYNQESFDEPNMVDVLSFPTSEEVQELLPIFREFFGALKVGVNESTGVQTLYHISDSDRNTWNEGVRDYLEHAAKMDGDMYWRLEPKQMFSEAPDILKFLSRTGVLSKIFGDMFDETLPIKVDIGVMDKIHQGTDARRIGAAHTHDLTDDDLYHLIDAIADPLAIAVSAIRPNDSIVFFTEMLERTERNGNEYYNPVIVPLCIKARGPYNNRHYEITSAYGLSNRNTWNEIIDQLSSYPDELLYVNRGKLSRHESPQFSRRGQRTYVAHKELGLRRLADTLQDIMSHSRNRVPDEWGYKKIAPELHKPSSPSIIDQPASETQGENKADPNEERRDHVSGLFTGGPEAYWRPSLAHVGSNSGTRYFGWGLYAANWREGALVYMPEGGAIMEQTWWTHRPAGDESHLLVDGEPLSEENAERVATTIAHLMEEYGVTTQEMNEKFWRGWDDTNMNGDMAYRTVEWFFKQFTDVKNPAAAASRALYMHDIDGVKIPMGEETDFDGNPTGKQLANYVSFSDENLRVDHVYEYNPETDAFEKKWHETRGAGSRFTETPLGQELVAHAFDVLIGVDADLLLRPWHYGEKREPGKGLVTAGLGRELDMTEEKGFAAEVSARISRFGTREGDPTLREIRARCGSKERFYEVMGAVFEAAVGLKLGVQDVITQREFSAMEKRMPLYAWVIRHNAQARATALGRKAYIMGRRFAERLHREALEAARAEVERQRAKASEARAQTRAAEAQTRNAERREETERHKRMRAEFSAAEADFIARWRLAEERAISRMRIESVREQMKESIVALRVREAQKRAVERERGVSFQYLKGTLGVDIRAELRALAGSDGDPVEVASELLRRIELGFDKWVREQRPELLENSGSYWQLLNEQGEKAYRETMGNVLKAVARELSYGKLRESILNAIDLFAHSKHEIVHDAVEGKLARVISILRIAQNADVVALTKRRIKSALAEANKRLSSEASSARTRYMTSMRRLCRELLDTFEDAVDAQGVSKSAEKKRQKLTEMKHALEDEIEKINDGKDVEDLAKDETLTERQHKDAVKLMFLERFGDLSYDLDPEKVWAKSAEAEGFVRDALFEHVLAWEAKKEAAAEMSARLMDALPQARGWVKRGSVLFGALIPSWFDRMKWPLKTAAARAVIDEFERRFAQAATSEARLNRMDGDAINKMAATAYGLSGRTEAETLRMGHKKWMELISDREARWANELSLDGMPLSRANLIYIYASLRQEDVHEKLAHNYNGFAVTDEEGNVVKKGIDVYLERVKAELTGGDLALADEAVKFFTMKRVPLSAISSRLFGLPVYSPTENYLPLSVQVEDGPVRAQANRMFVLFPNFLKNRVWHSRKLDDTRTLYNVLQERSLQQNRWMAYAELYQLSQLVFNNPDVAAQYKKALGATAMKSLQKQFNEIFAGLEQSTSTGVKWLRSMAAVKGLGFNVKSAIRQWEGVAAWAVDMGIRDTAGALKDALACLTTEEGRKRWREAFNEDIVRNRMDTGSALEQRQMISLLHELMAASEKKTKAAVNVVGALQKLSNASFIFLKYSDALACVMGIVGLRPRLENKWIGLGYSREDARRLATQDLDVMIQRLQQSGRPEYLSSVQRGGLAGAMLTMFTGPAAMSAGIYVKAFHDLWVSVREGDAALRREALSRLGGVMVRNMMYAMLMWLTGGLFVPNDMDEEDETAYRLAMTAFSMVFGGFGGLFLFGALGNTAQEMLSEWMASGEPPDRFFQRLEGDLLRMPVVDMTVGTVRKMWKSSVEFADSDKSVGETVRFALEVPLGVTQLGPQVEDALEAVGLQEDSKERTKRLAKEKARRTREENKRKKKEE